MREKRSNNIMKDYTFRAMEIHDFTQIWNLDEIRRRLEMQLMRMGICCQIKNDYQGLDRCCVLQALMNYQNFSIFYLDT